MLTIEILHSQFTTHNSALILNRNKVTGNRHRFTIKAGVFFPKPSTSILTDIIIKKIMKKLTVFGLILCAQMSFAQDKNTDALGRLVKAAIDYSPRIKEQQQLVSIGDYKTKIQEAALKPQVQSELSVTRIDPVAKASFAFGSTSTELSFQPNMNYNANVGANYTIADWGKQALAIERAKLETNLSKNNVEGLKQNYAYQVANLY